MSKQNQKTDTSDREIVTTRLFDAPPELVYAAFVDRDHIGKWWGPNGFTTTTHEKDVRPGGVWRFIMHGPDGTNYPNKIVYSEVVPHERLAYSHGTGEPGDKGFHNTITFEAQGGKALLTMRAVFGSPEEVAALKKFGAVEGGQQTLERLAAHLAQGSGSFGGSGDSGDSGGYGGKWGGRSLPFVIEREFNAPRELVFKVWTEAEHLSRWWGPKGCTIIGCKVDLRPGGVCHYGMRMPNGLELWGKWVFREVVRPERLVYVVTFADAKGGDAKNPMSDVWPMETLSTMTFTERAGKTKVRLEWVAINATQAEIAAFDEARDGMVMGWGGTLDKLVEYLAKR